MHCFSWLVSGRTSDIKRVVGVRVVSVVRIVRVVRVVRVRGLLE